MSGNDRIDSDLYIKLYKEGDASKASGLLPSGKYYEFQSKYPVNPNVKWETTITRNVGLDFGMFNGRLTVLSTSTGTPPRISCSPHRYPVILVSHR